MAQRQPVDGFAAASGGLVYCLGYFFFFAAFFATFFTAFFAAFFLAFFTATRITSLLCGNTATDSGKLAAP